MSTRQQAGKEQWASKQRTFGKLRKTSLSRQQLLARHHQQREASNKSSLFGGGVLAEM
jgi:hypothetical protein